MGKIVRITITFAHKKVCKCSFCGKDIEKGTPYFIFGFNEKPYGNYLAYSAKLCNNCLIKAEEDFKRKEGNYGEWLKRKIVRSL